VASRHVSARVLFAAMGCLEICIYVAIILSWIDLSRLMGAMTVVQRG
jgi:hypothetical protein